MLAGLHYLFNIFSALYKRFVPARFTGSAIENTTSANKRRRDDSTEEFFEDHQVDGSKKRGSRLKPSTIIGSEFRQSIAVLTSGGDAQGMNPAIRAVARMGLYYGAKVYAVWEGYEGMLSGGDFIKELTWQAVSGIINKGGTVIGSARSKEFRTQEGRKKAAYNMITRGISNLIVIGGDGSLTGANIFRQEWKDFVTELLEEGKISESSAQACGFLNIVGMVGSIDNDFCGTDMTIGADSALHRIIEAVDAISTTASSHQRAFVLEVMGRHCGYLALISGLGAGADWVFLPEDPVKDGWEDEFCNFLKGTREAGKRLNIIIVAEGARDVHGNEISAQQVTELIKQRLQYDTRTTVLGHVQRGGVPSAFDRVLASRMGAEATLAVLDADEHSPPCVICIDGNQIVKKPLMECVEKTSRIQKVMKEKRFDEAATLRGSSFQSTLKVFRKLRLVAPPVDSHCSLSGKCEGYTLGLINVGAPAGGINSAGRAAVRLAQYEGHTMMGIKDGFDGLVNDRVKIISWQDVTDWDSLGGSKLGTKRTLPSDLGIELVARKLRQHRIQGLIIIGGFEAYQSGIELMDNRERFQSFRIPIVVIPATISNNIPGTEFSLGADTALNVIVESVDQLKQSASSATKRVFVIETMGGYCGYLATLGGLASGADAAYIYEEPSSIESILEDCKHLANKITYSGVKRGIILRNEKSSDYFGTDFLTSLYQAESKKMFTARNCVLGHIQQGGAPSPFDRMLGIRLATFAIEFILTKIKENLTATGDVDAQGHNTACLIGLQKKQYTFISLKDLKEDTDFPHRLPKKQWWLQLQQLLRIMAKHQHIYKREAEDEL
ncbi:ATP-dependent 6-phosphofructokinase, liver type-like [Xenia sp. Carnegie-2017]|uniref:ATP-dependent 6-phosphofructokinase, liver type-like n=1 Tax=Xenia sp. Carnegie-2017 TaxID=2897299 RepID=UPI001F03FFCF|nr:ATP-dependent 6-phosphofructokinase, liver type-like [Xenia sp. Carnegie-2017]XP_046864108.1 ATP-dependent 6-phosphofructokinase, liver type-like [Xenia sp. Carnegie-2017]